MTLEELIASMETTASESEKPKELKTKWGTLYVRSPTLQEVENDSETAKKYADGDDKSSYAFLCARMICDENGTRRFDTNNPDHIKLLSRQPFPYLQKVMSSLDDEGAQGN